VTQQRSLYWYDLETFGTDHKRDRISQFAGIRTDEDLNIIDEPLSIYCQLSEEILPEPISCLVTGITPALVNSKGLKEYQFIRRIHEEFSQPNTCVVGYNNLRFDDEFIRYTYYRNFYDPYEREWKNGNSRWDIIDMVRLAHALRPDGINWPKNEDGITSFKLELLSKENNITHDMAHDAMSDVYATIGLARLIKQSQPNLYDYVFNNRSKQALIKMLDVRQMTPILHVSSRYPSKEFCSAIVAPIAMHPVNKNSYIVYNLSVNPTQLIELNAATIKKLLFTPTDQLPEGTERIPLKTIQINKCPIIAPLNTLDAISAKRIGIKLDVCYRNLQTLKQARPILDKIRSVFNQTDFEKETDPEFRLYDGFFADKDKSVMVNIRNYEPGEIPLQAPVFDDDRLSQLFVRYKARNFPDLLSDPEKLIWDEYCQFRLFKDEHQNALTIQRARDKISQLKADGTQYESRMPILDELLLYLDTLEHKYRELTV